MAKISLCAGVMAIATAIPSATASSANTAPGFKEEVTSYSQASLAAAELTTSPSARISAMQDHLRLQSQTGSLVDSKRVHVAKLSQGEVVWDSGAVVHEFRVTKKIPTGVSARRNSPMLAMELQTSPYGTVQTRSAQARGAGLSGFVGLNTGVRPIAKGCVSSTVDKNNLQSCWDFVQVVNDGWSSRDFYEYARWSIAIGDTGFINDHYPQYMGLYSKPSPAYASRTKGMTDWIPHTGTSVCSQGGSLSIGIGAANLSLPITDCEDVTPFPNTSAKSMSVKYDQGFYFGRSRVRGLEMAHEIYTTQGGNPPWPGDFSSAKFCQYTLLDCSWTTAKKAW